MPRFIFDDPTIADCLLILIQSLAVLAGLCKFNITNDLILPSAPLLSNQVLPEDLKY